MFIEIPISNSPNDFLLIDELDLPLLMGRSVFLYGTRSRYPAIRVKHKNIFVHKLIAEAMGLRGRVDHKSRNKLDSRRNNLRLSSPAENSANSQLRMSSKSGLKGVYWHKSNQKWEAGIRVDGQKKTLGYFECKFEAAKAYDLAALSAFGDSACTNFMLGLLPVR